jgi:hypothetical protein
VSNTVSLIANIKATVGGAGGLAFISAFRVLALKEKQHFQVTTFGIVSSRIHSDGSLLLSSNGKIIHIRKLLLSLFKLSYFFHFFQFL